MYTIVAYAFFFVALRGTLITCAAGLLYAKRHKTSNHTTAPPLKFHHLLSIILPFSPMRCAIFSSLSPRFTRSLAHIYLPYYSQVSPTEGANKTPHRRLYSQFLFLQLPSMCYVPFSSLVPHILSDTYIHTNSSQVSQPKGSNKTPHRRYRCSSWFFSFRQRAIYCSLP